MKKLFLKTLMTALVLLTGGVSSAWAEATVIYGRALTADAENGYSAWSADDVAASGTDLNVWVGNFAYNETYGLYQSGTGSRSTVMTFSHTAGSIQTLDIVFNNLGNTGHANNYSYIKIGSDIEIQSNQQNQTGTVIINGTSSLISDCNVKNYNRGGDSWTIHVEINTAKNKVTALTIVGTEMNGKSASYSLASATALSNAATYNTVSIGFNRASGSPAAALTSIKIAEEEQPVIPASYTINYVYSGSTVKTEEGNSSVDATVNAELPITVDGQKYYAADGATTSIELVDGTNVLNVDLRKANEYAYSVSNNFGTNIASGTYIEGEPAINVYWSKYVENEGVWYECEESTYGVAISGALNKTVNYTTASSINYFVECEKMHVSRSPAASDAGTGYSGGLTVRHYSNSYWYTDALAGGIYSLSIPYRNNNSSDGIINLYLRDGEGTLSDTEISITGAKQSSGIITAEDIEIPEGYALVLNNTTGYNSNVLMDYVALTKTGDLEDEALATAKEELLIAITYAESIEADELADAIGTAQAAYEDTDATAESVNQATAALVLAVKQYAKGALQTVLELAEEMSNNSGELDEEIQEFKTELDGAIEAANAALDDEEKTPEEIMTALDELSNAALVFASETLAAAIEAAKAIDTEGKNGAEELADAIQAAEAALSVEDIQGFYQAGLDLKQAIDDFNAANEPTYDPNVALLNPSFEFSAEGTASTAQALTSGGSYYGWTLPALGASFVNISIGDASNCNGQAFGIPTAKDGNYYYYTRRGWNSSTSADASLSTTMTALPVGHYTLTMAYKGLDSWDDSHSSKGSYLKLNAVVGETELGAAQTDAFEAVNGNNAGKDKFTDDANWQEASLEFDVETEGDVTLNIVHHLVGGVRTDVVIDNLTLAYKSPEEIAAEELAAAKETLAAEIDKANGFKTEARTEGLTDYESAIAAAESAQEATSLEDVTQAIDDLKEAETTFLTANLPVQSGTYYIFNPKTEKFLARGNAYGTAAVVADYGVAINVEAEVSDATPDGNYSLVGFDNNASYGFDEWMYADAGGNDVRTYTIAKSGDDGYTITNTNNSKLVYVYLKEDGNKYRVAGNAIKDDNYTDDAQTVWQFIKPETYETMIADRIAAEKTAAFTAAGIAEDAEVALGESVEMTFATGNAWTQKVVRTENNQPATNDNGTEMWQATGYYTQTVSDLPSGLYKVSIQAFYRNGGADECVTRYNTGYNTVLAYLDANGSKVQVKSWATGKGDGNDPNDMGQAKAKFDAGKYLSETYAYVGDDGKLNLTVYNPAHIGNGWFIVGNVTYTPQYALTDVANEDDYAALDEAIENVPTLGFLPYEAAPYNNVDILKTLATAKTIDKTANNLASTVQELIDALAPDKWTINTEEVNAVYDGSFGAAENDGAPAGWETTHANGLGGSLHARTFVLTSGMGNYNNLEAFGQGDGTRSAFYIRFDGTNSAQGTWYSYGKTEDYTMPLEANTAYRLSLQAGAWGDYANKQLSVTIKDAEGNNVVEKTLKTTKKTSSGEGVDDLDFVFTTNEAGNYTLSLWNANGANYAAIVSNIELYRAKTTVTMAVTDAQYATFCAPFDVTIPEDVTAYTVDAVADVELTMTEVTTTIPANTPVVLYSESAYSEDVEGVADPVETPTAGLLTGVYEDTPAIEGTYILQKQDAVAFFKVETAGVTTVKANHAYMTVSDGARAYYFGGEATAIGALKALMAGDAEVYDLNGRRVVKLQKGVNVIRTKEGQTRKVMVK